MKNRTYVTAYYPWGSFNNEYKFEIDGFATTPSDLIGTAEFKEFNENAHMIHKYGVVKYKLSYFQDNKQISINTSKKERSNDRYSKHENTLFFGTYKISDVEAVFKFAQDMKGKHNRKIIMKRNDSEIFRDDIRGKLAEVGIRNTMWLGGAEITGDIDFSVSDIGVWDSVDLIIDGKYVNVKSSSEKSNFLLIETSRYNENMEYNYKNNDGSKVRIDYYCMVRVGIKPMISRKDLGISFEEWRSKGIQVYYEPLGFISHKDFKRK